MIDRLWNVIICSEIDHEQIKNLLLTFIFWLATVFSCFSSQFRSNFFYIIIVLFVGEDSVFAGIRSIFWAKILCTTDNMNVCWHQMHNLQHIIRPYLGQNLIWLTFNIYCRCLARWQLTPCYLLNF